MSEADFNDKQQDLRPLRWWLIIGIFLVPMIFTWFVLRPGYSFHVRLGAFMMLGLSLMMAAIRALE